MLSSLEFSLSESEPLNGIISLWSLNDSIFGLFSVGFLSVWCPNVKVSVSLKYPLLVWFGSGINSNFPSREMSKDCRSVFVCLEGSERLLLRFNGNKERLGSSRPRGTLWRTGSVWMPADNWQEVGRLLFFESGLLSCVGSISREQVVNLASLGLVCKSQYLCNGETQTSPSQGQGDDAWSCRADSKYWILANALSSSCSFSRSFFLRHLMIWKSQKTNYRWLEAKEACTWYWKLIWFFLHSSKSFQTYLVSIFFIL